MNINAERTYIHIKCVFLKEQGLPKQFHCLFPRMQFWDANSKSISSCCLYYIKRITLSNYYSGFLRFPESIIWLTKWTFCSHIINKHFFVVGLCKVLQTFDRIKGKLQWIKILIHWQSLGTNPQLKQKVMTNLIRKCTGRYQGKPQSGAFSSQWARIVSLISGMWGVTWDIPV